jgi:hypothetical protein
MNSTKLSIVPFRQASLCLDCDMITAAHTHCFVCGSAALLNLARTLNGEDDDAVMPALFAAGPTRSQRGFATDAVSPAEARGPYRWQSLRGITAVVHRAITVALIGTALVLAATTQARGQSCQLTQTKNRFTQRY